MNYTTTLATCLALSLVAHAQDQKVAPPAGKHIDLLRDTRFQNGFEINAPKNGKHVAMGVFQPPGATGKPVWRLCQWNTIALKRGYLKDSPDMGDFAISSVNIGWEVTGVNNVAIQIRNLDIKVDTKQHE